MRFISLSVFCAALSAVLANPASAVKTTTQSGLVAKDAFTQQRGGKLSHTHEVYSFGRSKQLVLGWKGANRGRGAKAVYMMAVPLSNKRQAMLSGTKISRDLAGAGAALVRQHLREKGLGGRIELGDAMTRSMPTWGSGTRLKQQPITRANGSLRYTVTQPDGEQRRYLVSTNPKALATGKGALLGKVEADNDMYR